MSSLVIEGVSGAPASGRLSAFSGENLEAVIDRAFAPGTPLTIQVDGMTLSGKSLGTQRLSEGSSEFRLRARMTNLRRVHRERLSGLSDALHSE